VCAVWLSNTVTIKVIKVTGIEEACRRAIEAANQDNAWRSTGVTFIDAILESDDADPWQLAASHLPMPLRLAEDSEAQGLRAALLGLLNRATEMGRSEAKAWRIAKHFAGRSEPDAAPQE
jgi:hypothetical protein